MGSPHVAVIVVHGVGDPGANTSVANVASILLAHRDQKQHTLYEPFDCEGIQIGVRAAPIPEQIEKAVEGSEDKRTAHSRRGWLDERSPGIIQKQKDVACTDASADVAPSAGGLPQDVAYTRDQLRDYVASAERNEATYATTRLTGTRRGVNPAADQTVHLYELYWADLVSLRKGLRFFEDMYQLFLHIAHIGLLVVNAAMAEKPYGTSRTWRAFAWWHRWAVRFLTLPIPLLYLMVIPVVAFSWNAFVKIPATSTAVAALALLLVVGAGYLRFKPARGEVSRRRIDGAVAGLTIVAVLIAIAAACSVRISEMVVGLLGFSVGAALVLVLSAGYEKIRPGAFHFAIIICSIIVADLLLECVLGSPEGGALHNLAIAMRVGGTVLVLLSICWLALFICSALAFFFAVTALQRTSIKERNIAVRFAGTAFFSLGVPTVIFFLLAASLSTNFLSLVLNKVGDRPYEGAGLASSVTGNSVMSSQLAVSRPSHRPTLREHLAMYWVVIIGIPLIPTIALIGIAIALATWVVTPSVISEFKVPIDDETGVARQAYGSWLDRSQRLLWAAGSASYIASLLIVPASCLGYILLDPVVRRPLPFYGLVVFVLSVSTLWLLPQPIWKITEGIAVPVRSALDVDAYLRLFPLNGNPRARIFARYSSLLRYIANWTSPSDPDVRYDSIVIVAHSQGTVISADLFRYLKLSGSYDDSLKRLFPAKDGKRDLTLRMLTMGCPLRQLYGSRFPHTYRWAAEIEQIKPKPQNDQSAEDEANVQKQVGVDQWINAYRSGDYVGRYLWDAHDYWAKPYAEGVSEFCVGPGAHVHYWDGTAPVVAQVIDDLITA